MNRLILAPFALICLAGGGVAQAAGFCMLAAETYYQQLYCEVTAHGRGSLPSFADFKRNTPTVQALLLKRPARSLGIEVALPQHKRAVRIAVAGDLPPAARPRRPVDGCGAAAAPRDGTGRLSPGRSGNRLCFAALRPRRQPRPGAAPGGGPG